MDRFQRMYSVDNELESMERIIKHFSDSVVMINLYADELRYDAFAKREFYFHNGIRSFRGFTPPDGDYGSLFIGDRYYSCDRIGIVGELRGYDGEILKELKIRVVDVSEKMRIFRKHTEANIVELDRMFGNIVIEDGGETLTQSTVIVVWPGQPVTMNVLPTNNISIIFQFPQYLSYLNHEGEHCV